MQRLRLLAATALLGMSTAALSADTYSIDSRHTFPVFEVSHLGFSTQRGRFNKVSGKISLDAKAKKGSVEVEIDAASIDMGLEDWDKHMKNEDFFHVEKYPTMRFQSDKFVFRGDKPVEVHGELTLLGVTKPVKLEVTHFHCGVHPINKKQVCGADLTGRIKRSDFGMTKFLPGIGDDVRLIIPVEAFKE
ncbi:MAG: YceI family protein [Thiobacillaceae bacterium]|nr:YceI family protein [Thiobacillaceae bacterium]